MDLEQDMSGQAKFMQGRLRLIGQFFFVIAALILNLNVMTSCCIVSAGMANSVALMTVYSVPVWSVTLYTLI